jgi:hypothetical protein
MASTAYPFKVGDLIKIERPEFKTVAYGILTEYYENGWWQVYQAWHGDEWYMSTAKAEWMEVVSRGAG